MRGAPWVPRLLALAIALVATGSARGGERVHTVLAGESPSSLAKRYYGDHELGGLLLRYNGRTGTVIRAGEKLTIPYCEVHRVRAGDTWSGLARRHLGRAAASPVLAELNGLVPGKPLRVGQSIVLPVIVRHTLSRGETLASVAQLYYGDDRKTRILQELARIEDARRLSVGTVVEVPLTSLRLKETEPEVAEVKPPEPEPVPAARFSDPLAEAARSFASGEYDRARASLEALREPVASTGTPSDKRELARLLAFVYVAFDLDDEACKAYRSGPPPEGEATLDPDLVSPRIREVLSKCSPEGPDRAGLDVTVPAPQIPSHAD